MEEEFYFCTNGHCSDRISSSGICRECLVEQNTYQLEQKERKVKIAKTAPADRQKRLRNQKEQLELRNAYRTINHHERRAAMHPEGSNHNEYFTHEEVVQLIKEQTNECAGCLKSFDIVAFETDHIIPLSRGGTNTINNIQLLCRPCNMSKGVKVNEAWISEVRSRQVLEWLQEIAEEESYATKM